MDYGGIRSWVMVVIVKIMTGGQIRIYVLKVEMLGFSNGLDVEKESSMTLRFLSVTNWVKNSAVCCYLKVLKEEVIGLRR